MKNSIFFIIITERNIPAFDWKFSTSTPPVLKYLVIIIEWYETITSTPQQFSTVLLLPIDSTSSLVALYPHIYLNIVCVYENENVAFQINFILYGIISCWIKCIRREGTNVFTGSIKFGWGWNGKTISFKDWREGKEIILSRSPPHS